MSPWKFPWSSPYLLFNPEIGLGKTILKDCRWLPTQDLRHLFVVTVSSTNSLRSGQIKFNPQSLSRDFNDHLSKIGDRDQTIRSKIEGFSVARMHETIDTLNTIINIEK